MNVSLAITASSFRHANVKLNDLTAGKGEGQFARLAGVIRFKAFFVRDRIKPGKEEGTTAAAHRLARIVHGMIKSQKPYDEKEAFKLTPQSDARRRKALEKQEPPSASPFQVAA